MPAGVTKGKRRPERLVGGKDRLRSGQPVTEGAIPEKREVDPLELGQTEVLSAPGLDVLDPVDTDRSSQDMSKAEHVELLEGLARLGGKR